MGDGSTEVSCSARVADGAIRGVLVAAVWIAYFGPSEMQMRAVKLLTPSGALGAGRYGALMTSSFAAFFGVYNGVFCGAERAFGEGAARPMLAGGVAGGALGAVVGPPASRGMNVALCSISTALLCSGSHALVSMWKR